MPKKKRSKRKSSPRKSEKKFKRPVAKVLTFDEFMQDLVLPAYGGFCGDCGAGQQTVGPAPSDCAPCGT